MRSISSISIVALNKSGRYTFILEENMRKDVKIYCQEWPYVIGYMLRNTKTPYVSIILLAYLCKMVYNKKKLLCLLNIAFIWS